MVYFVCYTLKETYAEVGLFLQTDHSYLEASLVDREEMFIPGSHSSDYFC